MKATFFDQKNSISIVGFMATLKLACNSNKIHEGAAMRVFPHFVQDSLAIILDSRMCAENWIATPVAFVQNEQYRSRKLERWSKKVISYLLTKTQLTKQLPDMKQNSGATRKRPTWNLNIMLATW